MNNLKRKIPKNKILIDDDIEKEVQSEIPDFKRLKFTVEAIINQSNSGIQVHLKKQSNIKQNRDQKEVLTQNKSVQNSTDKTDEKSDISQEKPPQDEFDDIQVIRTHFKKMKIGSMTDELESDFPKSFQKKQKKIQKRETDFTSPPMSSQMIKGHKKIKKNIIQQLSKIKKFKIKNNLKQHQQNTEIQPKTKNQELVAYGSDFQKSLQLQLSISRQNYIQLQDKFNKNTKISLSFNNIKFNMWPSKNNNNNNNNSQNTNLKSIKYLDNENENNQDEVLQVNPTYTWDRKYLFGNTVYDADDELVLNFFNEYDQESDLQTDQEQEQDSNNSYQMDEEINQLNFKNLSF